MNKIQEAEDFRVWNKKPLEGIKENQRTYLDGKMFASVNRNEAFGKFFIVEDRERISLYVLAYPKRIIKLIILQDFEEILDYDYNPAEINDNVSIQLELKPKEYDEKIEMLRKLEFVFNEKRKKYEAMYYGPIRHTSSGRIFGRLIVEG